MTTQDPSGPNDQPVNPAEEIIADPLLVRAIGQEDFRRFLDHVPVAIAVSRRSGQRAGIVYANPEFERLSGISLEDGEEKSWDILGLFKHEEHEAVTLARAAAEGDDFLGTFRKDATDQGLIVVQAYAGTIENEDGSENYRIVALVDVSYQERAQRDHQEQQVRHKDVLLKELQHRVKNNLQLITALIRLEARSARRGEEVDFDRLSGRIESLSLLYRTLASDDFGPEIDLGHYLSQIASASVHAYGTDGIELELRVGYAPVSVNVAMPTGLIVNELLTNAFKHAFRERDRGVITIECAREGDSNYLVVVADDGVGLPAGISWPASGKLASLIVQSLCENAKNTSVSVEPSARGTRVAIRFEHIPPSARTN